MAGSLCAELDDLRDQDELHRIKRRSRPAVAAFEDVGGAIVFIGMGAPRVRAESGSNVNGPSKASGIVESRNETEPAGPPPESVAEVTAAFLSPSRSGTDTKGLQCPQSLPFDVRPGADQAILSWQERARRADTAPVIVKKRVG
ncbi:MAG: hypothetical protein AAFR75_05545 [Pseudomonadota bacterium]